MPRSWYRELGICAGLLVLTAAAYRQAGSLQFVNYDDPGYVSENSEVRGGLTWHNVAWAFTTGSECNWHPLTWLSHMLDVELFGADAPGAHHLVNLAFHLANTLLLFLVLRGMTAAVWPSALVAALFAVHPLHVESVAWVSERKDLLSTLLGLMAMAAYAWHARRPGAARYGLVFVLLALGLMAKPMLVTLPGVFLLLDFWPLGRLKLGRAAESPSGPPERITAGRAVRRGKARQLMPAAPRSFPAEPTVGRLLLEKLPLAALSVASGIVTYLVQRSGGAMNVMATRPLAARLANALIADVAYLGKMLWPVDLAVPYPLPPEHDPLGVLAAGLFLTAASLAVAWGTRHGCRYLAVGWLWYLGMLLPVIGIIQVGDQALADRYSYLPLVGVFMMLAWGAADLCAWQRRLSPVVAASAIAAVLACAVATARQVSHWTDSRALSERALAVTENNYIAHYNLGWVFLKQGDKRKAFDQFAEATRITPSFVAAHNIQGLLLAEEGRIPEAVAHYERALRVQPATPQHADVYNNLGLLWLNHGETEKAVACLERAVEINPQAAELWTSLGSALLRSSRTDEAIQQFEAALEIDADYVPAHYNLGLALEKQGRTNEAIEHYREALRIDPQYARARKRLEAAGPAGAKGRP